MLRLAGFMNIYIFIYGMLDKLCLQIAKKHRTRTEVLLLLWKATTPTAREICPIIRQQSTIVSVERLDLCHENGETVVTASADVDAVPLVTRYRTLIQETVSK